MKTNEFMTLDELKRIAEENDYEFSKELGYFCFKKRNHTNNIDISGDVENKIWISTGIICDDEDFNMIKASVKFAETPLDEREEEKKCQWQHRWMDGVNGNFLNLDLEDDYLYLDDKKERWYKKTTFTQKEIDDIKEKYNTDLSDFERVEVEE